jgi:hypothetical protein
MSEWPPPTGIRMELRQLQRALERAARLLKSAGAKSQSEAVASASKLLADADGRAVDEFVDTTIAALNEPELKDLPASMVAAKLREVGVDRDKFEKVLSAMKHSTFKKDKIIEVAALYTGSKPTTKITKPKALKAIELKFKERVFLESKSRLNDPIAPW